MPPKFFERTRSALFVLKSALFVMKSGIFVQTNVAVNTNLTSKVPFVFGKHIYLCPLIQAIYVVNIRRPFCVLNILRFAQQPDVWLLSSLLRFMTRPL